MRISAADLRHLPVADLAGEALGNLYAQRQRSILALLGILIGTASIVAMLTIGHMAQLETLKAFRHLGVDMLQIHAMPAGNGPGTLNRRIIEHLPVRDPAVLAAAPLAVDHANAASGARAADVGLVAATSALPSLLILPLSSGRFIGPIDDDDLVGVIGSRASEKLSAPGAPVEIGSPLRIRGYVFTVIGMLAPIPYTALDPTDFNDAILIPLAGARRVMSPADPGTALLRLRPDVNVKVAGGRVSRALANSTATLQVLSARDLIAEMNAQKAIHSRLLTAVGAISLLVGGIGVMNVMLMSVMERRREIGLRAAIGASPADLGLMFLAEAVALAGTGGLAGLILGLGAAALAARASGWTFSVAPYVLVLGPAVATLVGVAFGLYPAIKASRLSPIEALRAD